MLLRKVSASLFLKIFLLLNAFIIVPALFMFVFVNVQVKSAFSQETSEKLLAVSQERMKRLHAELYKAESLAHTLARDNYAVDLFKSIRRGEKPDPSKMQRIASNLKSEIERGQGVYGNMLYYHNGVCIIDGVDGESRNQRTAVKSLRMGEIKLATSTGRPIILDTVPIFDDSDSGDLFKVSIELSNVTEKVLNNDYDKTIKALILDENGLVIASDHQEQILKYNFKDADEETADFFGKVSKKDSGIEPMTWHGERYIAAFCWDKEQHLVTISYTPISDFTKKTNALIWGIALLLVICVIIGLFLSGFLSKKLVIKPVQALTAAVRTMAKGDFTQAIVIDSRDEIGQMGMELEQMKEHLAQLIGHAATIVEQVDTGMHSIASGNMDLSQRTQEQASTLEEIASTMVEIAASIEQTAVNSGQAGELSQSTLNVVQEGQEAVHETIDAMKQITDSSIQIREIIRVVNDIAFQTNLLALNAAVEAARAGEQGRGFAVVAAEVRNLAGRTAESSKEIEKLIKESVVRVERGDRLVQRSGEILRQIVVNTQKASDVVIEIAAAMREQSGASTQIQNAIEQLNQATQQNAALVEEIASSSEELNDQANGLAETISVFKVKEANRVGASRQQNQTTKLRKTGDPQDSRGHLSRDFKDDDLDRF